VDGPDARDGSGPTDAPADVQGTDPHDTGDRVGAAIRRTTPTTITVIALAIVATRRYIGMANADALLPALMSTQRWTLFYWGQDRLANLVPLLTVPIRDPIWNFRIQSLLIAAAFFALGAVFVTYHAWSRRERIRPGEHAVATAVAGLAMMVPFHVIAGYRFAIEQLYFVSILCWVVAAWAWLRHRRRIASFVGLLAAMLLNPSLLLATPLAWVLDPEPDRRGRRFGEFAVASASAFGLTSLASRFFATGDEPDRPYNEFRIDHLREGVRLVVGNVAGSVRDHLAITVVVLAAALVAASFRHLAPRSIAVYLSVPAFALGWLLLFSTNGWVIQNLHEFRYFYPLYASFALYVAGASTELVLATRRWRPSPDATLRRRPVIVAEAVFLLLTVIAAIVSVGRTDVTALDATRDDLAAIREHEVRLVAGQYWSTWPTVVAARASGLDVAGASYRSDPIEDQIRSVLDDGGESSAVLCSGVGVDDCVAAVNEWSTTPWGQAEVLDEVPLVITIHPLEQP
jgi:hypothetical protein